MTVSVAERGPRGEAIFAQSDSEAGRARLAFWLLALGYVALACLYHELLEVRVGHPFLHAFGKTLTRLYLPDSDLYTSLYAKTGVTFDRVLDDYNRATQKNIYGVSVIGWILDSIGVDPMWMNISLVVMSGSLLRSILRRHGVGLVAPLALLFLNPSTVFYSQTLTKEPLLLFAYSLFIYCSDVAFGWGAAIGMGFCFVVTSLLRLEAGIPLVFSLVVLRASPATMRRWLFVVLFGLAAALPLLYANNVVSGEVTDMFRRDSPGQSGLGPVVDAGLRQVPLAGLVLIPIRALQNATEPFPSVNFEENIPGTVSLYFIVLFATLLMSLYFTIDFVRVAYRFLSGRWTSDARYQWLICAILFSWMTTAANPFVHTRYMFSFAPSIPVLTTIARHSPMLANDREKWPWETGWTWIVYGAVVVAYAVQVLRYVLEHYY